MKFVIAGGSGFVGEALVSELVSSGDEVVVLSRSGKAPQGARAVRWDPAAGTGAWSSEIESADVVINLAGENIAGGRWSDERKKAILESRLQATRALVNALAQASDSRPRRLVSASAVGYYGPRGDEPLAEHASAGSDFLASVCRQWEEEAMKATPKTRVVIIRIGLVLHPSGGALQRMLLPFKLGAGGRLGSGKQWWSWIDRADLVKLFRWASTSPAAEGVYNAAAPNPVTNEQFTKILAKQLRRPAFLPAPATALRIAFGEMADALLLSGQRVLPKRAVEEGFTFEYPTLEGSLANV